MEMPSIRLFEDLLHDFFNPVWQHNVKRSLKTQIRFQTTLQVIRGVYIATSFNQKLLKTQFRETI